MYVILVYDVNVKRVTRVQKLCKNYLVPVQKSVFEGGINEAKLEELKKSLKNIIVPERDSVIIYHLDSVKFAKKEQLGTVNSEKNII